jgi:hypothetical protein
MDTVGFILRPPEMNNPFNPISDESEALSEKGRATGRFPSRTDASDPAAS